MLLVLGCLGVISVGDRGVWGQLNQGIGTTRVSGSDRINVLTRRPWLPGNCCISGLRTS